MIVAKLGEIAYKNIINATIQPYPKYYFPSGVSLLLSSQGMTWAILKTILQQNYIVF